MTDKAMTWLGNNWSKLGLGFVGLFGLVMLRSMVRSVPVNAPSEPPVAAVPPGSDSPEEAAGAVNERDEDDAPRILQGSFGESAPNIKEELAEMVRGNPDAAAAILKNWINNAA